MNLWSLIIAFIAGAGTVLAFAPFHWPLLALIELVVLFAFWLQSDARSAAMQGFAYGAGLMGFGVFWLHNSIAQFGGLSLPLAVIATLLFALLIALFFALAGGLSRSIPGDPILVVPAVWTLVEWLRGWVLSGFPWLSLGYSQIDLPLAGYAPFLGVYGISFLLALSAMLMVRWRSLWVLLLPLIWVGGWWLGQQSWTEPDGEPFQAALVQGNIPQQMKWKPEELKSTVDTYLGLSAPVASSKLVVWPETAVPTLSSNVEENLLQPLHEQYKAEGRSMLLGIPAQGEDGKYYNTLLALGADGRGRYDKRHLVPLGEFTPLKPILEPLARMLSIPMSDFSPGKAEQQPVTLAGHVAGTSICYEDAFGTEVSQAMPQAAFLVNASNDAWFGDSLAPHQHLQIVRMRARENSRYMLRATNTGISAVMDEKGKVLADIEQFQQGVAAAQVQPMRGATWFSRFGNWPVVLLTIGLLALSLRNVRMGKH